MKLYLHTHTQTHIQMMNETEKVGLEHFAI